MKGTCAAVVALSVCSLRQRALRRSLPAKE